MRSMQVMARPNAPRAILDHFHDAGVDWAFDVETEMREITLNRKTGASGETYLPALAGKLWRHQTPPVRFWIISMMLVLIGLSTLKLR